ncbi:MAG: tetratricopeptide repeat protein [Thermodesulfobacteriota bacterium]|nr:tetratricopeptide repeat protein [Thermodesulfobacteriota bacterium]
MIVCKKCPRLKFAVCLFLVVIILAAYWQLPGHGFLAFDDNEYITQNFHLYDGITHESIAWAFSITDIAYWHPVTWLSHMLDFQLFGLNPGMHHLTNLFLHVANALLLFIILNNTTGSLWKSAFVAAIFALHPMNVESVSWASERKNVLSTFFWMLTILAYVRYAERSSFYRYLLILFVFVLGLMSKPMLVTLPFVLLLLDYWPLCRFKLAQCDDYIQGPRQSDNFSFQKFSVFYLVLEKIPLLLLSAFTIYLSSLSVQRLDIVISTETVPMNLRITNALISYLSYIKKMIWPLDLIIYYPYPESLPIWQAAGAGLLLIFASVLVFWVGRTMPYLLVGWLWYLGTLVPVIGLMQAGLWPAIADRFAYVPLIGLFIIIAWAVPECLTRWRYRKIALATITGMLISILMTITWIQVGYWSSSIKLFEHALDVTPDNSVAYQKLCEILADQSKPAEALKYYSEVLRLNPGYVKAHNNIGNILVSQGNDKAAIYHYNEALRIDSDYAGAYYNLGKIFANHGKTKDAILHFQKALQNDPDMTQALYNLSWIRATSEDEKFRNGIEAIKLAEKLCKLQNYSQPLSLDALAAAYAEAGRFKEAVLTAKKGLELALEMGPQELALSLEKRLKLYQTGRPYQDACKKMLETGI